METGSGREVTGAGRRENGEPLLHGCGVSVEDDEGILETDSGDGCTTIWIYLMPTNCMFGND